MVATVPHELHRMRRAALNPHFSKASIRRLEPIIREIVSKLLKRMDSHQKSGELLPTTVVYKAMTSDIINNYAFGKSGNCMDMEDYNVSFFEAVEAIFEASHLSLQFGWLGPLMESLPMALTAKLMPGMAHLFKMQQVISSPPTGGVVLSDFCTGLGSPNRGDPKLTGQGNWKAHHLPRLAEQRSSRARESHQKAQARSATRCTRRTGYNW